MFALADARPEMDIEADLPQDLHPPMTTKDVPCNSTEKDCSAQCNQIVVRGVQK